MSRIVLATLNARYSHCAFGLRYLYANLRDLQSSTKILEFTTNQDPRDIAEAILAERPEILGLGIYIWNTRQSFEVVSLLKRIVPELRIVLGGPEVSYETESQPICRLADLTIQGEGDLFFREICTDYFRDASWPAKKWIVPALPALPKLELPYVHYTDSDIRNRIIYVEASRGCPYKCEYCLSSLDKSVRGFDLDLFLGEMDRLIERGARQFKFIDRTFNLNIAISSRILEFFLGRIERGLFLHFEMVPDRLPEELKHLIRQFPRGSLQFEIGIQTWNPEVARLVSRNQNYARIRENFAFLAEAGTVHTHADLIVGLPGETLESFAAGFDALSALRPDEIQVGLLKRLKGTPIIRHDAEWGMAYQEHPPFQILRTRLMSFETIQHLGRFSRFWDLIANSGNFKRTLVVLKELAQRRDQPSLFRQFEELTNFLHRRHPQAHGVALLSLVESVWLYLCSRPDVDRERVRAELIHDYCQVVRRDIPAFLRAGDLPAPVVSRPPRGATPERQLRHIL